VKLFGVFYVYFILRVGYLVIVSSQEVKAQWALEWLWLSIMFLFLIGFISLMRYYSLNELFRWHTFVYYLNEALCIMLVIRMIALTHSLFYDVEGGLEKVSSVGICLWTTMMSVMPLFFACISSNKAYTVILLVSVVTLVLSSDKMNQTLNSYIVSTLAVITLGHYAIIYNIRYNFCNKFEFHRAQRQLVEAERVNTELESQKKLRDLDEITLATVAEDATRAEFSQLNIINAAAHDLTATMNALVTGVSVFKKYTGVLQPKALKALEVMEAGAERGAKTVMHLHAGARMISRDKAASKPQKIAGECDKCHQMQDFDVEWLRYV